MWNTSVAKQRNDTIPNPKRFTPLIPGQEFDMACGSLVEVVENSHLYFSAGGSAVADW